jgi:hypothetical protein
MEIADVRAGVYRHYRGEYYLVLGLAHHSETMETFVVYVPLYVREGPRMAVRPAKMFFGRVEEEPGHMVLRFEYIGAEMPATEAK